MNQKKQKTVKSFYNKVSRNNSAPLTKVQTRKSIDKIFTSENTKNHQSNQSDEEKIKSFKLKYPEVLKNFN